MFFQRAGESNLKIETLRLIIAKSLISGNYSANAWRNNTVSY